MRKWFLTALLLLLMTSPAFAEPVKKPEAWYCGTWQLAIDTSVYPEDDMSGMLNASALVGVTGDLELNCNHTYSWRPSRMSANRYEGLWEPTDEPNELLLHGGLNEADWVATFKTGRRYDAITLVNPEKPEDPQHGRRRHRKP